MLMDGDEKKTKIDEANPRGAKVLPGQRKRGKGGGLCYE